uniref:Ig-like domain-containing protein n=1 Tax=Laticauda laticaudata TaxID=8630 RepID=A0A8C5WX23_LATLA
HVRINESLIMCLLKYACFVSGQATITPKQQFISVKEGDSTLLNCSYQGTQYSLQWYRKYPGGQPEFMVLLSTSGTKKKENVKMTLDMVEKITSLCLKTTQLKDSAVYFCAIRYSGRKTLPGCLQR